METNEGIKLINIDKMIIISKKVIDYCTHQNAPIIGVEATKNAMFLIDNMKALDEKTVYKYSCLCEPKLGEGENLRSKWMQES